MKPVKFLLLFIVLPEGKAIHSDTEQFMLPPLAQGDFALKVNRGVMAESLSKTF